MVRVKSEAISSISDKEWLSAQFKDRLERILSPTVTASSLSSLADKALGELIAFSENVTSAYVGLIGIKDADQLSIKDLEDLS